MLARQPAPGITVVDKPIVAFDMAHQDHDMVVADGRHAGRRDRPWKFAHPVGGKIELRADVAEKVERRFTSAECMRASIGTAADDCAAISVRNRAVLCLGSGLRDIVRTAAHVTDDGLALRPVMPRCRIGSRHKSYRKQRRDEDRYVFQMSSPSIKAGRPG